MDIALTGEKKDIDGKEYNGFIMTAGRGKWLGWLREVENNVQDL